MVGYFSQTIDILGLVIFGMDILGLVIFGMDILSLVIFGMDILGFIIFGMDQCVSEPPRGRVSAELSFLLRERALCVLYLYRSLDSNTSLHN